MSEAPSGMSDEEIVRLFLHRIQYGYRFHAAAEHVYRLESIHGNSFSRRPLLYLDPELFGEYVRTLIATEHGHAANAYEATALITIHLDEDLISTSKRDNVDALGVRRRGGAVEWFVDVAKDSTS